MPRRTRRRSPSSSSDGEALNSFSSQPIMSAVADSTSACQVSAPRLDPRQLDSALEALADRADDLTDEELSPAEVVEAYVSHAEFEVAEALAFRAESQVAEASAPRAESQVAEASASRAELAALASSSADCVITGVSHVHNDCAIENKTSNAPELNSRDMHLMMHYGQEEREKDQQRIIERCKALQLKIDSEMREMLKDPEVSKLSDLSQILEGILASKTRELPSPAVKTGVGSSPSVQEKIRGPQAPPRSKTEF